MILNHPFLLVLLNEMKLKKVIPKETRELRVVVVWLMPEQV